MTSVFNYLIKTSILVATMARTKQTARKWGVGIGSKELKRKAAIKSAPVVGGVKKPKR